MRSIRKRLWLAAAAILVLEGIVASGLLVCVGQYAQGVSRANFERIEQGMTREEVETILAKSTRGFLGAFDEFFEWHDGPDKIWVRFHGGRVMSKTYTTGTVWERFKHQLWKRLPKSWR